MAKLTAAKRKRISTKDFGIPKRAKSAKAKAKSGNYPIPDKAHARNALSRVSQHGTPAEKAQVRRRVHAKYPSMGKKRSRKA